MKFIIKMIRWHEFAWDEHNALPLNAHLEYIV